MEIYVTPHIDLQLTEIMSPTVNRKRQAPILTVGWVRPKSHSPSSQPPRPTTFRAWASWDQVVCCPSTRARRITPRPNNRPLPHWRVPLRSWRANLLARALAPDLGLGRLGRGHITRDVIRPLMALLPGWIRVWINHVWIKSAYINVRRAWRCGNVHFNCLLGQVIAGSRSGDGCSVRGISWAWVAVLVGLRWHPPLEPIPSPLGLIRHIGLEPRFRSIRTGLKKLLSLLQLNNVT